MELLQPRTRARGLSSAVTGLPRGVLCRWSGAGTGLSWGDAAAYSVVQILGGMTGVVCAHAMFGAPLIAASHHARSGLPQAFSEFIATFGLLSVVWGCSRGHSVAVPFAVGAYITAAYWFTASTSFANPAVTIARAFTDTFAGIRPIDVPAFVVAQLLGASAATVLFRWLVPTLPAAATDVVVPTGAPVSSPAASVRHSLNPELEQQGAPHDGRAPV